MECLEGLGDKCSSNIVVESHIQMVMFEQRHERDERVT